MVDKLNKRIVMSKQTPSKAVTNFDEVNLGYSKEEAILEASRCLNCKNHPCMDGCPLHNNIPLLNTLIKEGKFLEAYKISEENNPLNGICGRVCQQEDQCEKACIKGKIKDSEPIAIGNLERFLFDYHMKNANNDLPLIKSNSKKVAIIGSGPAGLSCAEKLALKGYHVEIFEKKNTIGGLLEYGIPPFVLSRKVIDYKIKYLSNLGVVFHPNRALDAIFNIEYLLKTLHFDAIFLANGANEARKMGIKNEEAKGSYNAKEFLELNNVDTHELKRNHQDILCAKHVVVVGGGNVAIDVDRIALRNGAIDVHNLYRRSEKEMPARKEEYLNAINEGIHFDFLRNPTEVIVDNNNHVKGVSIQKMELGEPDSSGRRSPIPLVGEDYILPCDLVIFAIGSTSDHTFIEGCQGINLNPKGLVSVDPLTLKTNLEHVYAGGDIVSGPYFVVNATYQGKIVANSIDLELSKK